MLTLAGMLMLVGVTIEAGGASADTAPYELYCPGTPVGDISLNDVVTSGTISPSSLNVGDQFSVTNYQTSVNLPAQLASAAASLGNTDISGQATTQLDATGASPATMGSGTLNFDVAIPSAIPDNGLTLAVPSTPVTLGPFTATGTSISIAEDSSATLSLVVSGAALALTCTAYPNDSVPTGISTTTPTASPISPVLATATAGSGSTTTTAPSTTTSTTQPLPALTGAYELYCPGTPVGDIVLNDATTSGTISPSTLNVGDQFSVTNYQTSVNLPAQLASAAASLGNTDISGQATTQLDASGATPSTLSSGTLNFDVALPNPIPDAGLSLLIPSPPITLGPFTAQGSSIVVQEDSNASLSLVVSGAALDLTCTAYPNNSVPTGITTSAPTTSPISPVIAVASASTGSGTTTTTTSSSTTTSSPTSTTTSTPSSTTTSTPSSTTTTSGATTTSVAARGTTTTAGPSTGSGGGGGGGTVSASSSGLAFTGPGSGLRIASLAGAALLLIGLAILFLVDMPRSLLRRLVGLRSGPVASSRSDTQR